MAAPPIDFLNSFFWQFTTIAVAVVAVIGFLIYRYYLEPPISRAFMSARWSKGPVGFVQDDANQVHLVTSKVALPEGVVYTQRGFFLTGRAPYIPLRREEEFDEAKLFEELSAKMPDASKEKIEEIVEKYKKAKGKGPGRPPKKTGEEEDSNGLTLSQNECFETALQTPTLAGFGRAVFFAYDGAPLVSNLKTLSVATDNAVLSVTEHKDKEGAVKKTFYRYLGHADLRVMKEIIPATISRTQLANLYKWAVAKGYEKSGKDQMKLIYIAIAAAIPIACLGLVVFLILNGGGK